jgi:hypothetical protein
MEASVFPNPFTDVFTVELAQPQEVVLFDLMGRERARAFGSRLCLGAGLPAGVYVAKTATGQFTVVKQ